MAARAVVLFKFDKTTDGLWLGMFNALKDLGSNGDSKEASTTIIIASLPVTDYSLNDHQFIGLTLDMKGSKQIIVHWPRSLVIGITEGVPPENLRKMGF